MRFSHAHARAAAVLVDELNAGTLTLFRLTLAEADARPLPVFVDELDTRLSATWSLGSFCKIHASYNAKRSH
jgi:hypothetical protein